jgi:hypothetical protein
MTDSNAFERFAAQHLADDGSGTAHAERIAALIDERTRDRRQLPRWLALMKESPMRIHSRVAVGSPAVRIAAILVVTMLLAVALAAAGAAGQRLLAANGPIVVAQDGSGAFSTVTEALAAAEDGDEIVVRPGTYPEVVVIDKDITLRGDGPREAVILEFANDGPRVSTDWSGPVPYGVMLVDTEAIVSDLTVRGPNAAVAFVIVGGAPTLENIANELQGDFSGRPQVAVAPIHGAGVTIRNSLLDGPVWHTAIDPIPEHEDITGSGRIIAEDNVTDAGFWLAVTDGSAFLGNTITGGEVELYLRGSGNVLVAENETTYTIQILDRSDGFTVRDNIVHGAGNPEGGIFIGPGAPIIEGNVISDAPVGITVLDGDAPMITEYLLDERYPIDVDGATGTPVIEGNRFCGNDQDLVVPEGSALTLDPSNEVCDQ